jgi:competence protein ComEC
MTRWWILSGGVVVLVLTLFVQPPADKVVFLDVGQGDSILVQSGTAQVLIDGGQGMAVLQRLAEEMPWFDQKVDVVVATHPDRDHLEGLLHVVERYDVDLILLPQVHHDSQLYATWLTMLRDRVDDKKTAVRFAWAEQELAVGDARLTLLGPTLDQSEIAQGTGKTNNASILTRIDWRGMSWLLTADAEAKIERALVIRTAPDVLNVDVLKAGHHGSKTSTTDELVAAATPGAVVISVGADNSYGHPHESVTERLEKYPVFRTDHHGSVRFLHNRNQWLLSYTKQP